MRLLVTGGLGFIGSNFIRHVLAARKSVRITNLDLCTYAGNPANLADLARDPRYRWVRGDIADPRAVDRCMTGAEAVVHFAAETHVDRSILDAAVFLRTNVIGTGLGLYIAKQMLEAQGGRVWVESPGLGKGSTFFVELPKNQ